MSTLKKSLACSLAASSLGDRLGAKQLLTILFFLFSCFATLFSQEYSQAIESHLKRLHAHLIISDFSTACQEARQALKLYPQHKLLIELSIKAFAQAGDEKEMWDCWNHYHTSFPKEALENDEIHEAMAWGTIKKGSKSPLPLVRLCALLGAFYSNDAKSIPILSQSSRDTNSLIRAAAVKLISQMRDAQLADEISNLFHTEKNWKVRLELIKALGKMKLKANHHELLKIISSDQSAAEEKAAAAAALIALWENIERQELLALVQSNRAGLRLLACQVVSHLRSERDCDQMVLLASDNNSDVRAAALYSLGLMQTVPSKVDLTQLAYSKLSDSSPNVTITAAWLLTRLDEKFCKAAFLPSIRHSQREIRLQAVSALIATGKNGLQFVQELFQEHTEDLFFKLNLALGLIYQQTQSLEACQALHQGLNVESGKWMWNEAGPFRGLAPSNISQEDDIPNAPEAFNQLTRLEILNILAIMKYPGAENAIRGFLQQHRWGISGMAAALLLLEGDEVSLEIVKGLLRDSDKRIQLQAALTLSLWGGGEEAKDILEAGYHSADRETKEKILEGLGRIGARSSIPFLLRQLQEPQQFLRLIAASSLLQCLYH